ncbi:30S ribosomal protein S16 [Candidatus Kaiserbacteria bacterium RIFCSPHIGHO2_02_FULL_59_21]|uniref:Small ribosomal subunit protein bS16 n=2 Tax=Candidatus Kaiseribacteriota TaxID=1752734 RepID=A0A1F6E2C1_9BACT|nr:MAG: 30S ribosomal protein S16 [Candidatus Kaiserbacteria bacterium RIFCSPHIGHO2_01_FULL_58_22]OGG67382.1 MAG: 30S ribosomal protein S16 [Candidatus Kaiserbacteria bacterium RIFCSPHIGHO2_02_FULL_59_21]OGG80244.1 MAG: 30S ribosomal protein S16 [Candidatus Kaiserbacteria bacterium RIFCSPLOWO2_01_FULL_59_34]OGG86752.1 MAG: 30S ribosomal protein S16 [Candidatus Kaiserbacteria bacterium RIFCSPLOWO2_02_FULL_59_19]
MLKIRMQRTGRTNAPSFRIVVVEHTESPKTGNVVEKLGTYNPKTKERTLNGERIQYWLSVGAKASDTMHNMLISAGIIEGKKVNVLPQKSPPKKESEQKEPETKPASAEGFDEAKDEVPAPGLKDDVKPEVPEGDKGEEREKKEEKAA